jgi:hypothetical protein
VEHDLGEVDVRGNRGLAVLAGILGLDAAAGLVAANVAFIDQNLVGTNLSLGDLPGPYTTLLVVRFAVAAVLLVGAIGTLLGRPAGAIILAAGGALGLLAVAGYPYVLGTELLPPGFDLGEYFSLLFQFPHAEFTFSVVALFASALALIVALLPATRRSLRASPQVGA